MFYAEFVTVHSICGVLEENMKISRAFAFIACMAFAGSAVFAQSGRGDQATRNKGEVPAEETRDSDGIPQRYNPQEEETRDSDGIPQRYQTTITVEETQDSVSDGPSAQKKTQAKSAGYEDGFRTEAGEKNSAYRNRAATKSNELGYASALIDDYMTGVKTGRLDKAQLTGYKTCYSEYSNMKKNAKSKASPKVDFTKMAKNAGYTDNEEIARFKKGAESAKKAVDSGKKSVTPKFSNPYK